MGKHSIVINGIYEPSPTELCGGWPVYYNNTSVKVQEDRAGGFRSLPLRPVGLGADSTDTTVESEATKSFLLFCPYAMSWAITVLASVNDQSSSLEVGLKEEHSSGSSDVGVVNDVIKADKTGDKEKEKIAVDEKSKIISSSATTSPFSTNFSSSLSTRKSAALPFYTPSAAPLTLAFLEVTSNTQPELAHGAATWKVET